MSHELENFDPTAVKAHAADAWTPATPTVHADDYSKLLALYEMTANRADATQKKLRQLEAEVDDPSFYLRAINCPHTIDAGQIVLHYDPRQLGHNALNQLSRRLTPALKVVKPAEALGGRLPPTERQQLWMLIDETLSSTHGPLERGDICNQLAPVLAPLTATTPEQPALIHLQELFKNDPWLDTPLNFDEIRRNSDRYLYLRDRASNSNVTVPMVVMVNPKPDYRAAYENDVGDSLCCGKQLDHRVDRWLFPKTEVSDQ